MKRVKSGCIAQTLIFIQKPELGLTVEQVLDANRNEVKHYKELLQRANTKHVILEENELKDGSIIVKVKKQINSTTDTSEYFN